MNQWKSPPERYPLPADHLQEQLALLEQERDRILNDGPIAEKGTWIETCRVSNRKGWRQAMWKSSQPIFTPRRRQGNSEALCKTQYIGKAGEPQHQQALEAIARRKQLNQIQTQIARIGEAAQRTKASHSLSSRAIQ